MAVFQVLQMFDKLFLDPMCCPYLLERAPTDLEAQSAKSPALDIEGDQAVEIFVWYTFEMKCSWVAM